MSPYICKCVNYPIGQKKTREKKDYSSSTLPFDSLSFWIEIVHAFSSGTVVVAKHKYVSLINFMKECGELIRDSRIMKKKSKIRNKAMNRARDKGSFDKAAPIIRSSSTHSPFIHSKSSRIRLKHTQNTQSLSLYQWEKQQTPHQRCKNETRKKSFQNSESIPHSTKYI